VVGQKSTSLPNFATGSDPIRSHDKVNNAKRHITIATATPEWSPNMLNEDNIARASMKELRFGSQRDFLIIYLMIGLCGWKTIYGDRHDCEQPR
jgi:hypothetical protein